MKVMQEIELLCQTGNSNKFYEITVYLVGTKLIFGTKYGPIGKKGTDGAFGKKIIPDVRVAIANRTFENDVARLVFEANTIKDSKLKKGYRVASGGLDSPAIIKAVYNLYPSTSSSPAHGATQAPPSDTAFKVEITSILAHQIKVAKVLHDYTYEVVGEALNPLKLSLRTGDVVMIDKAKKGHWEILRVA